MIAWYRRMNMNVRNRPVYIANQESFEAFLDRARLSSVLAIDTEFLRERTYYAKLCLIQLATDSEVAIVDPFELSDLTVMREILEDTDVVKIFHAAGQDLEIIWHEVGCMPKPLFDTQVAAALLGHTQQIGYGALVHAVCGVQLKKIDSFTDWSRRPLSDSQLDYAADDVIYLPKMYNKMHAELEKLGRLHWLDPEFEEMSDPARFQSDERERYKRLKRVGQLSRRQLAAAREVTAWREFTAQKRNVPRKWVITDEQIVEACKREARTIDDLFMVRGMREKLGTRDARTVAGLMKSAFDASPDTWPEPDRSGRNEPNVDAPMDLMTALVRLRAKENGVAVPTLASHDDLLRVARGYRNGVDLLRGWRRALVGEELLELLDGKLSLSIRGHELVVVRADGEK
jgi:ribonuclease D